MDIMLSVFALHSFKSKDGTKYFVADCLTTEETRDKYDRGLSHIQIFVDEAVFSRLDRNFKPFMQVHAKVILKGDRCKYEIN